MEAQQTPQLLPRRYAASQGDLFSVLNAFPSQPTAQQVRSSMERCLTAALGCSIDDSCIATTHQLLGCIEAASIGRLASHCGAGAYKLQLAETGSACFYIHPQSVLADQPPPATIAYWTASKPDSGAKAFLIGVTSLAN